MDGDQGAAVDEFQNHEVIDISPITCPRCRTTVAVEDAYCLTCGYNLLESLTTLCPHCGKALPEDAAFCSSCGKGVAVTEPLPVTIRDREPEQEAISSVAITPQPRRSRLKVAVAALSIIVLLAGAGLAGWWFLIRTDFTDFDRAIDNAVVLAAAVQEETDSVRGPEDLDALEGDLSDLDGDLEAIRVAGGQADGADLRAAVARVADAQEAYLDELIRLAGLRSAEADPSEYGRSDELKDELDAALLAASALHEGAWSDLPQLSPTRLTAALSDLAEYRKEVLKQREVIKKKNAARAEQLATVRGFTGQVDGLIGRYTEARADLQTWADGAYAGNASIFEGYQVLEQNVELRQQIRSELAALSPPDPFSDDVQALISVIDEAITATESAIRGLDEYMYSWRYRQVRDTPGWQQFQNATDSISDRYESAVDSYETDKAAEIKRLEKKLPLPELPE